MIPLVVSKVDYCTTVKDDRQRFLQQVSKRQFRTVYHNANTCG